MSPNTSAHSWARPERQAALDRRERARTKRRRPRRWHPKVVTLLAGLVALPMAGLGVLAGSAINNDWANRQGAQRVESDAKELARVAQTRADLDQNRIPMLAISFAESIGLPVNTLDQLLGVNYPAQVKASTAAIEDDPILHQTATLRSDLASYEQVVKGVMDGTVGFDQAVGVALRFGLDVDALWYSDFAKLEHDTLSWHPPGQFELAVAALRQTYTVFLGAGGEIEGAIEVLTGQGGAVAKANLIQSYGELNSAAQQLSGNMGPRAQKVWQKIETNPQDMGFQFEVLAAIGVATGTQVPPINTNPSQLGQIGNGGLHYLADVDSLIKAAAADLSELAASQAASAGTQFAWTIGLLAALLLISAAGTIVAGRVLTRPLRRLSGAAQRVTRGELDVTEMPASGAAEVASTITAFNEMTSTLRGIEARTMALASEQVNEPTGAEPLPGRIGEALDATFNLLAGSLQEKERQRQMLHEAATHDPLTGLFNRAAILELLQADLVRRSESAGNVAVLFVDVDGLKSINDRYGHEAGDEAIRQTASALKDAVGDCDWVGRFGGDEFLVTLCDAHSPYAEGAAAAIRAAVARQVVQTTGATIALRASVGVVMARCDANLSAADLIRQADTAMYAAKSAGRLDGTVASIPGPPARHSA